MKNLQHIELKNFTTETGYFYPRFSLSYQHFGQNPEEAPVVLVVCVDLPEAQGRYGARGRDLYSLQDTAAAVQNVLLLAHSMGLGTCWVGAFNEAQAAKAIDLPDLLRPVALIPVGYPAEEPRPPGRKALKDVIAYR